MRQTIAAAPVSLFAFVAIFLISLGSCKPDPCEEAICAPCPSSRFVIQYQDSSGNCIPGFHSSAVVYAIDKNNSSDTVYTYNFSDSCQVGFLVQEDLKYHVKASNPTITDVIRIHNFEYQDPLEVTECCLCYPVEHIDGTLNGDTIHIEFNAGAYENTPYVRELN